MCTTISQMAINYVYSDAQRASPPHPSTIYTRLYAFLSLTKNDFYQCAYRAYRAYSVSYDFLCSRPLPTPSLPYTEWISKQAGRASIIIASQCIFNCIHFLVQIDLGLCKSWGENLKFFIRPAICFTQR